MNQIKNIIRTAVCVAILIGGQIALSSISGVEIVTVLLLCFSFTFGIKSGLAIATTFSLLRCFIFGFQINVIVLYLIYYNLFALFFGWLGKRFKDKISLARTIIVVVCAVIFTILFTVLDDVITPLIFAFSEAATKAYFFASLYAVVPQTICTAITVSVFLVPLTKVLRKIKF